MRIQSIAKPPLPAIDSIEILDQSQSDTIASFGTEVEYVQAPAGYAYQVLGAQLAVLAPIGAGSGTHSLALLYETEFGAGILGVSVFGSVVNYTSPKWVTADSSQSPPASADQGAVLSTMWATNAYRLMFVYQNLTDVSQTQARTYKLYVRKIKLQ